MSCAIICMGASATFHLFKEHSHKSHKLLAKVDYAGISIMIAGSSTPPYYYSFFCEETHCKTFHFFLNGLIFSLAQSIHRTLVFLLLDGSSSFYDSRIADTKVQAVARIGFCALRNYICYSNSSFVIFHG